MTDVKRTCSNRCVFASKDKDYDITKWYRCKNKELIIKTIDFDKSTGTRSIGRDTMERDGMAVDDYMDVEGLRECSYYEEDFEQKEPKTNHAKESKRTPVDIMYELAWEWYKNLNKGKIQDVVLKVYMETHGLTEDDVDW